MGRSPVLNETRFREDIVVLSQYTDENGVCETMTPAQVLSEHYGYKDRAPAYRDIEALQNRGNLTYYPPGAKDYRLGYQVNPLTLEALEKRMANAREQIAEELPGIIEDLRGIIRDMGRLAMTE